MRLLMRAAKNPLTPAGAAETLRLNTIGNNNGNLMFAAATHALLSTESTTVDTQASFKAKDLASRVNNEYDGVVLPLANCFRPAFKKELEYLTRFIQGLDTPFAMLSGGAQIEHDDPEYKSLDSIADTVKSFCKAVLEKSTTITVRGQATADYLATLGFDDVEVIGCPSLTRMGRNFALHTHESDFGQRVAYNVETSKDIMGETIHNLERSGAMLTYFPQDIKTLEALFWCRETYPLERNNLQPLHLTHPHISEKKVQFHLDAAPWIAEMRNYNMAIGPRIHGAVAAISAGTPALLIAHDMRTKELAEYHRIPFITPPELAGARSPEDIWNLMDYSDFNKQRSAQVDLVVDHLENNGFTTTLSENNQEARLAYFQNLSAVDYAPPVEGPAMDRNDQRFAELRRKAVSLTEQIQALDKRLKEMSS